MNMNPDLANDPDGMRGLRASQAVLTALVEADKKKADRLVLEILGDRNVAAIHASVTYMFGFFGPCFMEEAQQMGPEARDRLILTFLDPDTDPT